MVASWQWASPQIHRFSISSEMITPKTQFEFKRVDPTPQWRLGLERTWQRIYTALQEQLSSGLLAPAPSLQQLTRPFQAGLAIAGAAVLLGIGIAIPISRMAPFTALLPLYAAIILCAWYGGPVVGLLSTF